MPEPELSSAQDGRVAAEPTEAPGPPRRILADGAPLDSTTATLLTRLLPEQHVQLAAYRDLLLAWNDRFNLTAITEPKQVERRLFLDALRMLPALDEFVHAKGRIGAPPTAPTHEVTPGRRSGVVAKLIDIGTGAGFPGLVLKIARPAIDVTLIEATGKKVTFLQAVIADLGLDGVTAIHARAEDLGHNLTHRERYDLATARAVATLPALLELCMPFLLVGGRALFPKSADLGSELAEGAEASRIVGARIVSADLLPHTEGERVTRIVIADKMQRTPPRYPRRAGLPAREPLGRGPT